MSDTEGQHHRVEGPHQDPSPPRPPDRHPRTALVHAWDRNRAGRMNPQTRARCERAAELFAAGRLARLLVTVASWTSGAGLAEAMREALLAAGVPEAAVAVDPCGFHTVGEILVAERLLAPGDRVVSISGRYHLPRIRWLWHLRGRSVEVEAAGEGDWLDVLIEVPKYPLSWIRLLSSRAARG